MPDESEIFDKKLKTGIVEVELRQIKQDCAGISNSLAMGNKADAIKSSKLGRVCDNLMIKVYTIEGR